MGKKTPQSCTCLNCNAVISLPKKVPDGWWLALTKAWENPPALTFDACAAPGDRRVEEYAVKVKANGYTVKSVLPYLCPQCQLKLKLEAEKLWRTA